MNKQQLIEDVRQHFTCVSPNEAGLIKLIFHKKSLRQSELRGYLQITQQSVSRLVSSLEERGLIHIGERKTLGHRGSPSKEVTLNPNYAFTFGMSVRANNISLALVNFAGEVVREVNKSFRSLTIDNTVEWLLPTMKELLREFELNSDQVCGLGIGLSGSFIQVDDKTVFNTPLELEDWALIDLEDILMKRLNMLVWVENDGNAAALCEIYKGVGLWAQNFVYLYLAKGVGGGIVLNGELWRGKNGNAGEFAGGLPGNIYPFPNLELLRQQVALDGQNFETVDELLENFDINWKGVDNWILKVKDSLSIIASNASAILDIDAIVLGGKIPTSLAEKAIPNITMFDQKRRNIARATAEIVPSETKGDASAIGAGFLPLMGIFSAN